jgi:hypothetical protein
VPSEQVVGRRQPPAKAARPRSAARAQPRDSTNIEGPVDDEDGDHTEHIPPPDKSRKPRASQVRDKKQEVEAGQTTLKLYVGHSFALRKSTCVELG